MPAESSGDLKAFLSQNKVSPLPGLSGTPCFSLFEKKVSPDITILEFDAVDITLKTDRLFLKLPTQTDSEAIFNAASDPEVRAGLISWPESIEDANKWIRLFDCYAEVGMQYIFSMHLKDSGEFIGLVGLNNVNRDHRKAQIAFWCARNHWGMGYTTEAVAVLIRYAFRTHDLNRISCGCFDFNRASERVMQKLGMTYELTVRHEFLKDGKFIDVRHYSILKSEWEKAQVEILEIE